MKTTLRMVGLLALLAVSACGALFPKPSTVSNVRMATDTSGKIPTSSYAPGDTFYVFADLDGLADGQTVQARWYAVNAVGFQPNAELRVMEYRYQRGIGFVYFQLAAQGGADWPTGSYRVELYLDGSKVGVRDFTVQ